MKRGALRVYLGAAPGVGKTYAMLDEGKRRKERGVDVVVGLVETHGRLKTTAQVGDLEIIPRRSIVHKGAEFSELDVDAIVARRPTVVLVDELAHTNVPGSRNAKRWEDVDELLDAGIEVVTTLNIQHLESLNDVVEKITGVVQRETVPDSIVRMADQIELVDMSPEALRRRMAHGNIYPPERIDSALNNYFRPGNLGALRELALLWAADRVEESLDQYRLRNGITDTWETRERFVVAITGKPGGALLVRRAARVAAKSRAQLVGVYVRSGNGLTTTDTEAELADQQRLLAEVGGAYYEVVSNDVGRALVSAAQLHGATQLLLGASDRSRLDQLLRGSVVNDVTRVAKGIDIHVIAIDGRSESQTLPHHLRMRNSLSRRRQVIGSLIVVGGLPLVVWILLASERSLTLASDLLVCLVVVVAAGAIGGLVIGIVGAVVGSLLINYYLVPPVHTFTIGERQNLIALIVFIAVAATVSTYVNLAALRTAQARRARAEAEALSRAAGTLAVSSGDAVPVLLAQLCAVFGCMTVELWQRADDEWTITEQAGSSDSTLQSLPTDRKFEETTVDIGSNTRVVFRGPQLSLEDQLALRGQCDQLAVALREREMRHSAQAAEITKRADEVRTSLLQAVSHDLRTPLAGIKASVTSLLSPDVKFTAVQQREFLETVDIETDRLTRLVRNLLDMSRLQAGAVALQLSTVFLDDVIANALRSVSSLPEHVVVEIADDMVAVFVDAEFLERAVANVVGNAVAWSPAGAAIELKAFRHDDRVLLQVVDHGPGIPADRRAEAVRPFQQLGDGTRSSSNSGVGLGLAVTNGFVSVMGGRMTFDETRGGGLTVTFDLPQAPPVLKGELP